MRIDGVQLVLLALVVLVLLALVVQQPPEYEGSVSAAEYLEEERSYAYMTRIAVVVIGGILTFLWYYSQQPRYNI